MLPRRTLRRVTEGQSIGSLDTVIASSVVHSVHLRSRCRRLAANIRLEYLAIVSTIVPRGASDGIAEARIVINLRLVHPRWSWWDVTPVGVGSRVLGVAVALAARILGTHVGGSGAACILDGRVFVLTVSAVRHPLL